jgi:hypothetical protein
VTSVRVATPNDLPLLDRAMPSGRNDIHRGFLAGQEAGDLSYEHAETEHVRVLTLDL